MPALESSLEVVALVGAPNSGKTTLYNWLTNSKFKTVNYPGATVEYSIGTLGSQYQGEPFLVMDTPGTYSLFPKSADEEVTLKALMDHPQYGALKKVIVVLDGTQMARHLLLAQQVREAGFGLVLAVTMSDLLRKNGLSLNLKVLQDEFQCPVVLIEGLLGGGVQELIQHLREIPGARGQRLAHWDSSTLNANLKKAELLAERVLSGKNAEAIYESTARWDRVLLHPVFGLLIFVALMFGLFSSIFWLAAPFMDWVDTGFEWLNQSVVQLDPGALWTDFLGKGLIMSMGAVLIFVPQIFILFFGIGILESSGYLARAATLIDKPFSRLGMSGRSFVPLLSSFACAVPALMATRNISSPRDRWITNFIIPLMTCSARLPVYALLLSFLFLDQPAWKAGAMLAGLYFGSLLLGALAAFILNLIVKKSGAPIFMMELPLYRRPVWRTLFSGTSQRTLSYVKRAGPMIFIFSTLVWLGTTFPHYQEANSQVQLETSYLARAGKMIEPVFTPMGGDWRTGVGLLSAFAARETFVSSLAVLFGAASDEEEQQNQGLLKAMSEAQAPSGERLFTVASVLGLIVFFAIAMQCLSTFAMAAKESKSLKFAWLQLIVYNVVAYAVAVGLVQGLRAVGIA
jgi:ferrous iron transport protein B